MMAVIITGNSVSGDMDVDTSIAHNNYYNFTFTNNFIQGNCKIIASEIYRDLAVDQCTFVEDINMSPEVWFMYHNFFIDGKDIKTEKDKFDKGRVTGLRFGLDAKMSPSLPLLNMYTVGIVMRCVEFLQKYTI